MTSVEDPHPHVQVFPATREQKPVLANLLELYSHDFSDFIDLEIGPSGRFGYKDLDLFWTDRDRHPFLVHVENKLAGLVLIRSISHGPHGTTSWDLAEFFILRGYRCQGIGTQAAHQVWKRFTGHWEVRVVAANERAHRFWQHAITSFVGPAFLDTRFQHDGSVWHRFSFESSPADQGPAVQANFGAPVSGSGGTSGSRMSPRTW